MDNSVVNTEAYSRLVKLYDNGVFTEIDSYAKSKNGDTEVVAGFGYVNGAPCYAFSQNVEVNNGAITVAQCAKLKKIYDMAVKTGYPVIGIYDSNGVMLTEGFEALSAYGEIVKASTSVSGVVPQISVIAGACLGTSALIANMAGVVVAVKDADFYISCPSDTTVEESARAGVVDIVADDIDSAISSAKSIIAMLPENNISIAPVLDFSAPDTVPCVGADAKEIVDAIADAGSVIELKENYGSNLITALATVNGTTVGFVAFDGNAICPKCAYKAEAIIKLCDAYNLPIITIANADGVIKDNEAQTLVATTKLTSAYATATCPKISLITGQSIGTAYIILAGKGANADLTLAWDNAVTSPLDVDSAVAFLYNDRLSAGEDRAALEAEYKDTIGSAFSAAACGAVDDIFAAADTRSKVIASLEMLYSKRETTIARKHSVK